MSIIIITVIFFVISGFHGDESVRKTLPSHSNTEYSLQEHQTDEVYINNLFLKLYHH